MISSAIEGSERVLERAGLWPHPKLGRTVLAAINIHNSFPAEDNSAEKFAAAVIWHGKTALQKIEENPAVKAAVWSTLIMDHFVYLSEFRRHERDAVVGASLRGRPKKRPSDRQRKQQELRAVAVAHPEYRTKKQIREKASSNLKAAGVKGVSARTLRRIDKE